MYTADQKQKILSHSIKYGVDSAVDAFGVNRSSIYSWKKKLTESFEDYGVLQYKSTRSFKLRSRKGNWDYRIERYIQHIRMTHPGLTKEKVWVLVNDFCTRNNIPHSPSVCTVGRMIGDLKQGRKIPDFGRKLSFYANTSSLQVNRSNRSKRKKNRPDKEDITRPGHRIQVDTLILMKNGIRRYIINAVDVYTRLSYSHAYTHLSSAKGKHFLTNLRRIYPFIDETTTIQTDNGLEFLKDFQHYLEQQKIKQVFNYPKSPKMNAYIERYNGSLQDEFVYRHAGVLFEDINLFNIKLTKHILWYNTKRPHLSLDLATPIDYLLKYEFNQKSKMWWTRTSN